MYKTAIVIGLALVLAGCSSSNPDIPEPGKPPSDSKPQVPDNVPRYRGTGMTAPPADAKFTIFAGRVDGDMHVQRANRIKDELIASTDMKDWYVLHESEHSLLYYGYYRSMNDSKDAQETARAQHDRQKIDLMTDPQGNRPFRQALFVEINTPDPQARPEWNLVNAKGEFTVQIAVYKGTPERKQAAVDAVVAARAQGVEAYYYHGEMASLVCIGAWPEGAVKTTDEVKSPRGADPMQPLLVVPMTSDEDTNRAFDNAAREAGATIVHQQVQIFDPKLEATLRQFPRNHVNGMEIKHVVRGQEVYDSSLIRRIPHTAPDAIINPTATASTSGEPQYDPNYRPQLPKQVDTPAKPTPAPPRQPAQPAQPGGRLRSIGD